ncbi:Parallel beta-helix repeat [Macleaya cordata]|uniref:Parallel beta-helix repeat n=1 Tax=Macleaya cordata TaxID=56857 RepID=A0A200PYC1_MACCD|nr:Parallel beta-helix repeat [Macleaya cordata]
MRKVTSCSSAAKKAALGFSMLIGLLVSSLILIHVYGHNDDDDDQDDLEKNSKVGGVGQFSGSRSSLHFHQMNEMQALKTSFLHRRSLLSPSPSPSYRLPITPNLQVYQVTAYGADPTGKTDSTKALQQAISDAFDRARSNNNGEFLMPGITDLGGAQIHLEGGSYLISSPLQLPSSGGGNLMIHGGSIRASDKFPTNRYLIELSASSSFTEKIKRTSTTKEELEVELASLSYTYEDITLKDLMLDSNYTGGGIAVINSLRTTIDNCYISHFSSNGILVQGGHETYIHNSFLGQHITAGGDPGEKKFSGTGINLMGNDNAVTDVVIFSAAVGIMVSGQANILTGVHCYNKATGWGGIGIYLRLPRLTQTRIVNSYLDYNGIVAEDPVQLHISNTFFLGDGFILLKSINGVINGVNIVDNMFSGSGKGVDIVQLDQSKSPFTKVDQVVIDRNNVQGMNLRATVGRGSVQGNSSSWSLDFNRVLLFPNLIRHVQYTLSTDAASFPNHALRNVTGNRVVVESDKSMAAKIYVTVDQSTTI